MTDYLDKKSLEARAEPFVRDIISHSFHGVVNIIKSKPDTQADILGADYITTFADGILRIDVKARAHDYRCDDVVLETYSNMEAGHIGWTLDDRKITNIVIFVCLDTGTHVIMPFPQLQRVFAQHQKAWRDKYRVIQQKTYDDRPNRKRDVYTSEGIIIPRRTIVDAITKLMEAR